MASRTSTAPRVVAGPAPAGRRTLGASSSGIGDIKYEQLPIGLSGASFHDRPFGALPKTGRRRYQKVGPGHRELHPLRAIL